MLQVFLASRGNLRDLEKHLGVSYPTARLKFNQLLEKLGLAGTTDAAPSGLTRDQVLAEVASGALPDTDAYEAIHTGPYDTLGSTYDAIKKSMEADGASPADSMWEYYLTDPEQQPDPATWQTRVVWPVA